MWKKHSTDMTASDGWSVGFVFPDGEGYYQFGVQGTGPHRTLRSGQGQRRGAMLLRPYTSGHHMQQFEPRKDRRGLYGRTLP
ncbi:MAG: hypothetical protein MZU91_13235 [Desulfosudis oleivorans]|nr:hypothetical protein [Desulfosudis oleivorans]